MLLNRQERGNKERGEIEQLKGGSDICLHRRMMAHESIYEDAIIRRCGGELKYILMP